MQHHLDPHLPTPFEMLGACHERVEGMLALLQRLRERMRAQGADAQVRQAAADVMRYFDLAAREHHRDEELHVFPPLLAQGDGAVVATIVRLQIDHLNMEWRWLAAHDVLAAIATGGLQWLTPNHDGALDAFVRLYDKHIETEEQIVFPAAAALVTGQPLQAMGREMMARRGARPNTVPPPARDASPAAQAASLPAKAAPTPRAAPGRVRRS